MPRIGWNLETDGLRTGADRNPSRDTTGVIEQEHVKPPANHHRELPFLRMAMRPEIRIPHRRHKHPLDRIGR